MIPTFEPPHGPQPGFNRKKTPAIKNNPFGDNFTQRIPKGINNLLIKKIELEWRLLSWDQATEMEEFFDELLGTNPFYYILPPDLTPRKWICSEWGPSPNKGDDSSFTALFEEVP